MNIYEFTAKAIGIVNNVLASVVVILCVVIIFLGINGSYSDAAFGNPVIQFLILMSVLLLLACNEGFQVGILGIEHYCNRGIEEKGFSRAAQIHRLMFTSEGSKLKQLLIGQSFLVVLSSFMIANITTFSNYPDIEGVNSVVMDIFVRSGLPGAFVTICCAQLLPSMLAKEYPLEFLNIFGVLTVVRLALLIETIGIVQFVHILVQIVDCCWNTKFQTSCQCSVFEYYGVKKMETSSNQSISKNVTSDKNHSKLLQNDSEEIWDSTLNVLHMDNTQISNNGKKTLSDNENNNSCGLNSNTNNNQRNGTWKYVCDKTKYFFSTSLALGCFVFVIACMSAGYSSCKASVMTQFILAIIALFVVFYCEGLKVAIVSSSHLTRESKEFSAYPSAVIVHELLAEKPDGVKRFLLGRQLIVVPLGFLVAQITNFGRFPDNVFPPALYFFTISLGLPGMLILLQCSQLTPQLAAEANNLRFLSKKGMYTLTYIALCIEKLGLTSFSWILYNMIETLVCKKIKTKNNDNTPLNFIKNDDNKGVINKNKSSHDDGNKNDDNDGKNANYTISEKSFIIICEEDREETEEEFRSTGTTGTGANPYVIKTPTYSV